MGIPSLSNQVDRVFRGMFREGDSRHEAKGSPKGERRIYSYATLRTYRQRVNTFLNALPPERRPRLLRDLTPGHITEGLDILRSRGASDAHIKTVLAALRKLAQGMFERQWHTMTAGELVPPSLNDGLCQPGARGGYSRDQAQQIRALLASRSRGEELTRMFDLATASGLRHNELARLREVDIDRDNASISVRSSNAKGGRGRVVGANLDGAGRAELRAAIDAIPPGRNWLWTKGVALGRRLQNEIRAACAKLSIECKGVHGLRATFAEQYLYRRRSAGLDETAARRELSQLLGHNRVDVTYRYVPRLGCKEDIQ